MKHEFSDALRDDPERFELARRAAAILDEATRDTIFRPHARWDFAADENNSLELRIRGLGDIEIARTISVDESENLRRLRWSVRRTWMAWLKESSDRNIKQWMKEGAFPAEYTTV